jgi:hypothetical protein
VSGTVVSAKPDSFRLDYGDGVITVEMDDFDFYAEGYGLLPNDQVIVTPMGARKPHSGGVRVAPDQNGR